MQIDHRKVGQQVLRAQEGSGEAFAELYKLYFPGIYFFALRQLGDKDHAQDVAQETFLYIMLHLNDLQAPKAFHKWIYTIAATCIADAHRHSGDKEIPFTSLAQSEWNDSSTDIADEEEFLPENIMLDEESHGQIQQTIRQLTDAQREAIILYYFADFSTNEIADILGLRPVAVRKRLYDARAALAVQLGAQQQEGPSAATLTPPAKQPILSQVLDEDFRQCKISAAQQQAEQFLGLALLPMMKSGQLNSVASTRAETFMQKVAKDPGASAIESAGTKGMMSTGVKVVVCLAAILLLAGGGYALWRATVSGSTPPPTKTQTAKQNPTAPATSDTPPSEESTPTEKTTDVSTFSDHSAPAVSKPTPAQPAAPVVSVTSAPVPTPPTIIIQNSQLTYPQGAALTAAIILTDTGASASDAEGRPVPVTVTNLENINTALTGVWKAFLHATDAEGTQAKTRIVTIIIVK
ncbi:MAG: sigma-70 family RNA polymerase sigma factor [Coriobacteriia bacterium]|nr:sigma-70 family RNA polymerase sigma factor [Coriobacteriia bacterium]